MLNFKSVELGDRAAFGRYVSGTGSAYDSFLYWYAWSVGGRILWAEDDWAVYIKSTSWSARDEYLSPFLKDRSSSMAVPLSRVREYLEPGQGLAVDDLGRALIERDCPGLMEFESQRNLSEYVYRTADLISLDGHAYRGKRNRIRRFLKLFPNVEFHIYDSSWYDACMEIDMAWDEAKKPDAGESDTGRTMRQIEKQALQRALSACGEIGAKGCVITDQGRPAGFSLGIRASENMACIHFEKCHPDYREMYAWLSHEFLSRCWSDVEYVNREEDLGDPGLRKAKMSYIPVRFAEHYLGSFI